MNKNKIAQLHSGPRRCALCAERPGAHTYALLDRMTRHDVALCERCARALAWRACDPLLIGDDGTTYYAGRAVRAIWRGHRRAAACHAYAAAR